MIQTVLDQSYTEGNQDSQYGLGFDANSTKLAQQFTPSVTASCNQIKLYLKKNGTISGNVWVEIWTDSGSDTPSSQTGTDSTTVDANSISTSFELITFTFATPVPLTASTKYWIVADRDYTNSTSNYLHWGDDGSSPSYAGGLIALWDTSVWTNNSGHDFIFYEYYQLITTENQNYSYFM